MKSVINFYKNETSSTNKMYCIIRPLDFEISHLCLLFFCSGITDNDCAEKSHFDIWFRTNCSSGILVAFFKQDTSSISSGADMRHQGCFLCYLALFAPGNCHTQSCHISKEKPAFSNTRGRASMELRFSCWVYSALYVSKVILDFNRYPRTLSTVPPLCCSLHR